MLRKCLVAIGLSAWAVLHPSPGHAMERAAMDQLLAMAKTRSDSPAFREALVKRLGEAPIKSGEAFDSNGPDFVWAVEAATQPTLVVDDQPVGAMRRISGTNLWFHTGQLRLGTSHRFHYLIDGKKFGGSYDVPTYGPLSYTRDGVPQGRISEKLGHTSKLYGGMQSNYWIYVPAQYNPAVPAALMVWQDGERYITRMWRNSAARPSLYRLHKSGQSYSRQEIPVDVGPCLVHRELGRQSLRSVLYDRVVQISQFLAKSCARCPRRHIRRVLQPAIKAVLVGIAAFRRMESSGYSAASIPWWAASRIGEAGQIDGGHVYPVKVRREPKRNLRV